MRLVDFLWSNASRRLHTGLLYFCACCMRLAGASATPRWSDCQLKLRPFKQRALRIIHGEAPGVTGLPRVCTTAGGALYVICFCSLLTQSHKLRHLLIPEVVLRGFLLYTRPSPPSIGSGLLQWVGRPTDEDNQKLVETRGVGLAVHCTLITV